jgi:glutamate-1-semialdehyde 2,1-aminomutase
MSTITTSQKVFTKSESLFKKAQEHLVGGVNSPVRAFKSVGKTPLFFDRGEGPYIFDADNNRYIDYVGSWGPLILGHAHSKVIQDVTKTLQKGASFGAPCVLEIELAELVKKAFPSIELVRFVSSGTEAVMGAIRVARGYTKRNKILKFTGCYHGHTDSMLVQGGSGILTLGIPGSAGVPDDFVKDTIVAPYNNIEAVKNIFSQFGNEIAAIIVEPVVGNMGCVIPQDNFLQGLRDITTQYNSLLIFDEVMTGFRSCFGGVQTDFNITPDITTLGKVIGGGMPVGAYGGKKEIMSMVAPLGPVYQAGTLSGNPVAMQAGISTLTELMQPGFYNHLMEISSQLENGINNIIIGKKLKASVVRYGSMITLFFTDVKVKDFDTATTCDTKHFADFFWKMIEEGIYIPPSQYESWFISGAHSKQDIDNTIEAINRSI